MLRFAAPRGVPRTTSVFSRRCGPDRERGGPPLDPRLRSTRGRPYTNPLPVFPSHAAPADDSRPPSEARVPTAMPGIHRLVAQARTLAAVFARAQFFRSPDFDSVSVCATLDASSTRAIRVHDVYFTRAHSRARLDDCRCPGQVLRCKPLQSRAGPPCRKTLSEAVSGAAYGQLPRVQSEQQHYDPGALEGLLLRFKTFSLKSWTRHHKNRLYRLNLLASRHACHGKELIWFAIRLPCCSVLGLASFDQMPCMLRAGATSMCGLACI